MVTTKQDEALDRARQYVSGVLANPALLNESFKARKNFGPGYGYANRQEWWQDQQRFYPALFEGDDALALPEGWLDAGSFTEQPIFTASVKKAETVKIVETAVPVVVLDETFPTGESDPADEPDASSMTITDPVLIFVKNYEGDFNFLNSLKEWVESGKDLTEKQYAAAAKCMKKAKPVAAEKKEKLEEDGIYFKDGVVYKVVHAKQGSNKPYAKTLNNQYGTWTYVGQGPLWDLTLADRMTLEDAKEFGKLYGICCNCGATLTDENSIEDGIGPVCKKKFL